MPASWHSRISGLLKFPGTATRLKRLSLQDSLRLLGNISKLRPIRAAVRHLMCHNQMMFGVDSHLNIVADDTGAAAARCHRTTVAVGQRDLLIGRSKHLLLANRKLAHLLLQLRQLLFE